MYAFSALKKSIQIWLIEISLTLCKINAFETEFESFTKCLALETFEQVKLHKTSNLLVCYFG